MMIWHDKYKFPRKKKTIFDQISRSGNDKIVPGTSLRSPQRTDLMI
jgi:hypothetical protein